MVPGVQRDYPNKEEFSLSRIIYPMILFTADLLNRAYPIILKQLGIENAILFHFEAGSIYS